MDERRSGPNRFRHCRGGLCRPDRVARAPAACCRRDRCRSGRLKPRRLNPEGPLRRVRRANGFSENQIVWLQAFYTSRSERIAEVAGKSGADRFAAKVVGPVIPPRAAALLVGLEPSSMPYALNPGDPDWRSRIDQRFISLRGFAALTVMLAHYQHSGLLPVGFLPSAPLFKY